VTSITNEFTDSFPKVLVAEANRLRCESLLHALSALLDSLRNTDLAMFVPGAKGGTRTPTGVTRQILSLVRLPIPPLSPLESMT
jgi:hypothetical protein